jgi:hypothetical protein
MRKTLTALAFSAALAGHGLASAQEATDPPEPASETTETSPTDEAIARFKRGLELYGDQDYAGARVEFRRAYELSPNYRVLFNIGQVCFQLNDYACALGSFEKYLAEGGEEIASERRAEVQRDIDKLQTRVGRLEIVTNVPDVDVSVDDVYIGRTPLEQSLIVSTGKRRIAASKPGRISVVKIVDVAGTDSLRIALDLPDANPPPIAEAPPPPPPTPSRWTTLSWVGVGTAAALGVASGVTGVMALNKSGDLNEQRFAGDQPDADIRSKQDSVQTLATLSTVFLVASVATLGTTLVWTFTRDPKAEPQQAKKPGVRAAVGPLGLSLHGDF